MLTKRNKNEEKIFYLFLYHYSDLIIKKLIKFRTKDINNNKFRCLNGREGNFSKGAINNPINIIQ